MALVMPIALAIITYFTAARWLGIEELGLLFKKDSVAATDDRGGTGGHPS